MFDNASIQFEILWHTALAAVLGAVVGLEREYAGKPAGVRTLMLVCASSALFMMLATQLVQEFKSDLADTNTVTTDPSRALQGIIAGVSFIGAGTIINNRSEDRVEGLTTAASILFVTAIGVAVSLHYYILSVGVSVMALVVLFGIRRLETVVGTKNEPDGDG
jgi:putative Mg2+ transporter-C (MgtC) family protein